ncbi:MAG: PorP/SprF family type IX secretion system membrane protein [Saprospiraceae bacterium]|nr:PorP/SprF family type IX secretion system membrane protein [Saprospiraceae bacterium]
MLCISMLQAQQLGQSSLFFGDKYLQNPAYAGFDRSLSILAGYRTQWLGLDRNPVSQVISAHMPVYALNGGVGLNLVNEFLGAEKTLRLSMSYNYVFNNDYGTWSGGLRLGVLQKSLDGALLRTPTGIYEGNQINHQDPILPEQLVSGSNWFTSIGVYYQAEVFQGGVSVEYLNAPHIRYDGVSGGSVQLLPTVVAFGEYGFPLMDELALYPSALIKSDLRQWQVDLAAQAVYENRYLAGLGWRGLTSHTLDALIFHVGLYVNEHLKILYAYDVPLSSLGVNSTGSHELVLHYNLNKIIGLGLPPRVIYSPRY